MAAAPAAPRSRRRLRRWAVRLLIAAAATALALVALELYLRAHFANMFGLPESMRDLYVLDADGWTRPRPGHTYVHLEAGRAATVHLSSLGLRGAEVGARRPGERRLLCLGDSMVFGVGVEDDQTFTAVLEQLLAERLHAPVVARSGGAPGFSVFDQAKVLDGVAAPFDPDLVVSCVFLGNDFEDGFDTKTVVDGFLLNGPIAEAAADSWRLRLALRFRTCWFVEHFLRTNVPPLAAPIPEPDPTAFADFPPPDQRFMDLFMDARDETPALRRVMDHLVEALHRVADAADRRPLVVALLPCPWRAIPSRYQEGLDRAHLDPARHQRGAVQRRLAARCAAAGWAAIDLTPAFEGAAQPEHLFLAADNFHFDVAGHRLVADALAPELARRL